MIDWTKPIRTKRGHSVRVLCTNWKEPGYPVVALVTTSPCIEALLSFSLEGKFVSNSQSVYDLENIPERHVHADLIIAWANGAEIQVMLSESDWRTTTWPSWSPVMVYRIKP